MTDRLRLPFLVFLLLSGPLSAQAVDPAAEAPEALFDQKLGDVGVSLEANGTWTSRFALGWGEGFSPQGTLPGLGYPGLQKGAVFEQKPDFALTLRLMERYYLELTYHGSLDDRSFLVGYDGKPGESVQWVKAGNAAFGVPARAGQTLPEGRRGAPAVGAAFTLGPVSLEALGRYEDGARETKEYLGYRDRSAAAVGLGSWIRDRFFRLPGPYPLSGVRVLAADPAGPLGGYRDITGGEASVDTATGEVRLVASATRRLVVTWAGAAAWPNSPTSLLGLTASPVSPAPDVGTWFVLVQPGTPSAFELRDRYPAPRGVTGAIVLTDRATALPVAGHPVTQAAAQDWFTVGGDGEQAPFASAEPGLYPSSSAPSPPPGSAVLPWEFRLPASTSATSYALGTDVIPSSLVVVRNGVATSAWKYDPGTGNLTFDGPIFDTDAVEISLQRTQTAGKASDLVLWQGGRWDLAEGHDLEWNLQGRWNMDQGHYTTEDLQSPGRMAATVAYRGRAAGWSWSVAATGGALLADSTGHRRLYGQDAGGTQATLDGNALRPSAAPGTLSVGSNGVGFASVSLTQTNRSQAWYRDYWSNDPLTGTPQAGTWGTPGVGRSPAGADGSTGPYLVRGDSQRTDRLAVLEMDRAGGWSGLQVFLDQGKPLDLRTSAAVTLNLRVPEGLNGARVFFQAGTLAEDFDGTGAVRTVEYRSVPSLAFLNQATGVKQYFPVPENTSWGNDAEGDGAAGQDGSLVTREVTASGAGLDPNGTADTGWQTVRLVLTDAERQLLARTTGWRLVMVTPSGSGQITLLAGPVVFEGATWSVKAKSPAAVVSPADQVDPSRTDGHQLRVDWASASSWTLEARHSPLRPASYRTLAFQLRNATPQASATYTLTLTDAQGRGLTASWPAPPAAASGWTQARIDLRGRTLTFDGLPVAGATVSVSSGADAWDRMTISRSSAAADAGTWYLAEVEATDPVWEPMGTTLTTATWKQEAAWPSAAFPLVSGLTWELTSAQAGLTADDWSWTGKTAVSGSLGPLRASGEASVRRAADGQGGHGAYEATLPLGWSGGPTVELGERFSDLGLRSERLALALPWVGRWEARVKADGPPASLDQDYRLGWSSPGSWPQGLSATWNGSLTQTSPWSGTLGGFGPQWVDSWSWLPPPATPAPFALVHADAAQKASLAPAAVQLNEVAQVSQSVGAAVKWSPSGSWELKVPVQGPGEHSWSLTPSVGKKVDAVFQTGTVLFPDESARQAATWLAAQPGGLVGLPFGEQAAGPSPWQGEGLQTASVESTAALEWERAAASDWTDLALPVSGGTKFVADRGLDGTTEYRAATVSTHLQARAINLFGALGSTPVVSWYRTDVWTWSATGSWGTGTRDQDKAADASLATRSDLVLTPGESVGLPVTYQGRWGASESQSWGVKPTWSLRRPADLPFDLPRWLSPKAFRREWVQELSTSLEWGWQPTPSPLLRDLQVSWKGRFLLSDKSELSFTTRWGQQWQNNLMVVGLEAAVDLILAF